MLAGMHEDFLDDAAIQTLDQIAADESLPEAVRSKAAFTAANLLMSDYNDD